MLEPSRPSLMCSSVVFRPAAMQDEPGLAAQEPRRIDALRQIGADALLGIAIDRRPDVLIDPFAFHQCPIGAGIARMEPYARFTRGKAQCRKSPSCIMNPGWSAKSQKSDLALHPGYDASAVDLTFASRFPRVLIANVKSKTALESYTC